MTAGPGFAPGRLFSGRARGTFRANESANESYLTRSR